MRCRRPLVLLLAGFLAACGGDGDLPDEDRNGVDPLRADTVSVVDSLIDVEEASTAARPEDAADSGADATGRSSPSEAAFEDGSGSASDDDPGRERADGSPASGDRRGEDGEPSVQRDGGDGVADENPTAGSALAARYQLASVEGEPLPVTIGEGPECDLQLVDGVLRIEPNRNFVLRTTVHSVCGGERAGEELHTAEGSVTSVDGELRFDARYESLFAVAHGRRLADGAILIDRLETEGESHQVEWRFLR